MLSRINEKLIPEAFKKDALQHSYAKNIIVICLISLIAAPIYAVLYYYLNFPEASVYIFGTGYIIIASMFLIKPLESLLIPRLLISGSLFFCFLWLTYRLGGIFSATSFWFMLPPFLAVITGGVQMAICWMVLGLAVVILCYAYQTISLNTPVSNPGLLQLFSICGLIIVTFFLGFFAERGKREAEFEVEEINKKLQEANRIKSIFLSNVSHELRTPLNGIIGFAQLMSHDNITLDATKELSKDILTSAQNLLRVVNDVLDVSKFEIGKLEFHPMKIDLGYLLREIQAVHKENMARKSLHFTVIVDPELSGLVFDPDKFKQILYHYISNAIKFTKEGGTITLRLFSIDEEKFRVEVEDTGTGIEPKDIKKLFQPFTQLDANVSATQSGVGLGLALVRRIVEAQNGEVHVESEVGKGSIFSAVLPKRFS